MRKKRISAEDLAFLIVERLRENDPVATHHTAIAIVPHRTLGWAVVIPRRATRKYADDAQQIDRIQTDLRKLYYVAE
jgi:hypothetical protein